MIPGFSKESSCIGGLECFGVANAGVIAENRFTR